MQGMDLRDVISSKMQHQPTSSEPVRVMATGIRQLGPHRERCCRAVAWIESKAAITVGGDDSHIGVFGPEGIKVRPILGAHKTRILGMCALERGFLVTISQGHGIALWDVRRDSPRVATIPTPHGTVGTSVCTLYNSTFVVGTFDGALAVYTNAGNRLRAKYHYPYVHAARIDTLHAAAGLLVSGGKDQKVDIRRLEDMERVTSLHHDERVHSVRVNDRFVATGTLQKVYIYTNQGKLFPLRTCVEVAAEVVWCLRFINSRTVMATGDNRLRFINLESGRVSHEVETKARFIHAAEVLPNGKVAMVGTGTQANAIVNLPRDLILQSAGAVMDYRGNHNVDFSKVRQKSTKHPRLDLRKYLSPKKEESEAARPKVEDDQVEAAAEVMENNAPPAIPPLLTNDVGVAPCQGDDAVSIYASTHSGNSSPAYPLNHQHAIVPDPVQQPQGFAQFGDATVSSTGDSTRAAAREQARVPGSTRGNVPVQVAIEDENEVQVCEMDEAVQKMRKWEEVGLSKSAISRLEPGELGEAMAAYMLRYRVAWKEKFPSLKTCLHKLFNDDLLVGEDLVGLSAEKMKTLHGDIVKAMKKDEKVGAKTGLVHAAERFLRQLS